MSDENNPFFLMGAMLGEKSGEVTDLRIRIEELEAKLAKADRLAAWASTISERKVSPVTGGRLIFESDIIGLETALDAYRTALAEPKGANQ